MAIYYYKGPGQNALTAAGMEVAPSLYNLLLRMKREGYRVENLPASAAELEQLIQRQGTVFNAYAGGAKADFLKTAIPNRSRRRSMPSGRLQRFAPSGWRRSWHSTASFRGVILLPMTAGWHCLV